jgi:hypothetical protein
MSILEFVQYEQEILRLKDQVSELEAKLEQAENIISYYADKETYDLAKTNNYQYEFYCELPDEDIDLDEVNKSGYGGKLARTYLTTKTLTRKETE